ncbi:MAG TPA: urease accessory protein UreF [Porticoccaceae bacterium]|nr:urease accessory protein UreF [Porticoccaceae bacterium]
MTPDTLKLLHLLRLASPSLPVGAFAWSQGLEAAIELGWLSDTDDLRDWLEAVLMQGFARQDVPLLQRLLAAEGQSAMLNLNAKSLALRETAELLLEDRQTGQALLLLARSLEIAEALGWPDHQEISFVTAYGLMCRHYQLDDSAAASALIWAWLDNQIAAAIKLFPIGQTAGQRVIEAMIPLIPVAIDRATSVVDEEIGLSLPGQVMASMLHETQYSRMFRS